MCHRAAEHEVMSSFWLRQLCDIKEVLKSESRLNINETQSSKMPRTYQEAQAHFSSRCCFAASLPSQSSDIFLVVSRTVVYACWSESSLTPVIDKSWWRSTLLLLFCNLKTDSPSCHLAPACCLLSSSCKTECFKGKPSRSFYEKFLWDWAYE